MENQILDQESDFESDSDVSENEYESDDLFYYSLYSLFFHVLTTVIINVIISLLLNITQFGLTQYY